MIDIREKLDAIGPYVPAPDDDMLVCRCEEVTKGEIRQAVHAGMLTIEEIRRFLRCGMGLCQGQTCGKLVKGIVARELHVSPLDIEPATSRAPMRPTGMKDVIVLEGSPSIGHGGSSRNGGGVRQSGRDVRELPYAMYAVQNMWPTLSEELGVDVEYYQKGNLRLGKTDAHMEKLRDLAANANSLGLDMKIIDGKEVKEICPYLSDEIIGASWCPTDGHANPMLTTLAYYKRATELGVNFFTDAKVAALEKVKGKLRKVILESGEVFEADKVILAAGYESRFIARTVGIDVPMTKYFEEALVTEVQPRHHAWCCIR